MIAIYENGRLVRVEGSINDQDQYEMVITSSSNGSRTPNNSPSRPPLLSKRRKERRQNIMVIQCPECDDEITVPSDSDLGEIIKCSECDAELEVVGIDPLEVEVYESDDEEDEDEF